MSHLRSPSRKTLHGRTLVELLIAIAIGLVILGALTVVYLSSGLSSRQSTAIARMNEDAAAALGFIGPQLRMAGFSIPRIATSSASATIDGVATSTPDRNLIGAGIRACDNGFKSTTESFGNLVCATNTFGRAAFAVRFEGAKPSGPDPMWPVLPPNVDCVNSEIDTAARMTVGSLGVSYPLVESRFSITTSATGVPELSCAGNGNDFKGQPLVQYVEDMQLRFGVVAANGDSPNVVAYLDSASNVDALGGSTEQNWSRVVTVRVCLLMRSSERMPVDMGSNYVNCKGEPASASDGYTRRAYFNTIALRNRGGFARTAS
jgi:type IV pilus assembly protein PilW